MVSSSASRLRELASYDDRTGIANFCVTHDMRFARVAGGMVFSDGAHIVESNMQEEFLRNPRREPLRAFVSEIVHYSRRQGGTMAIRRSTLDAK